MSAERYLIEAVYTILYFSPKVFHVSSPQLLINKLKCDLNLKSDGGVTPLMAAVKIANQFMVNQLIKNVDISVTDHDGRTAVHWAGMVNNYDALKELMKFGPDTIKDAQDSKVCVCVWGETAFCVSYIYIYTVMYWLCALIN